METPELSRVPRSPARRRRSIFATAAVVVTAAIWLLLPGSTSAIVAGAAFTTDNPGVTDACLNGGSHSSPGVNCNIYTAKGDVWINGGPSAGQNHLTNGTYFFAVLEPGGQPDPNDDGAKNLSDTNPLGGLADPNLCGGGGNTLTGCGDAYTNRTFTVTGGHVSFYGGTHAQDATYSGTLGTLINLMPYDTTSNNGGVYILAICEMPSSPTTGEGAPGVVNASSCKYDAFKVKESEPPPPPGKIQSCFSGIKYRDDNKSGNFTGGETLLPNWVIDVSDGTNNYTATTDDSGFWSWCEPEHDAASGTTTYTFKEEQQTGWKQTGNIFDEGIYSSNVASHGLASFVYSVEVPNDESASADSLDFGNIPQGTVFGGKYYDTNTNGQWDNGEPFISGWKIFEGATAFFTSGTGALDANNFLANFTRSGLDPGNYTYAEATSAGWVQTGNSVNQTFTTGGASALLGPSVNPAVAQYAYRVTIPNDQPSSVSKVYFGNVCLAGGGGLTMGYWSNQNGQNTMTNHSVVVDTSGGVAASAGMNGSLAFLRWLNLRDLNQVSNAAINGLPFDPTIYTVANPKNGAQQTYAYRPWLLNANASNMAYMLSAQLSAMELNVRFGFVNPNALIYAPGTTSANGLGFATVGAIMAEANTDLATNSLTVVSNAIRTHQEALKNALDKANNNLNFVQSSPSTCPSPIFP